MAGERSHEPRIIVRVGVDAITYAVAITALATLGSLAIGITTGGGLVRGKTVLFVVGWLLMAYATWQLWPSTPDDVKTTGIRRPSISPLDGPDETPLERYVGMLPPNRWIRSPRSDRQITIPGKQFLASLLVLSTSFAMETVFGIT